MQNLISIFLILVLTACSSEVDKCVNSEVAAWRAREKRLERKENDEKFARKENNNASSVWDEIEARLYTQTFEKRDERSPEEIEAESRIHCMRISAKR